MSKPENLKKRKLNDQPSIWKYMVRRANEADESHGAGDSCAGPSTLDKQHDVDRDTETESGNDVAGISSSPSYDRSSDQTGRGREGNSSKCEKK